MGKDGSRFVEWTRARYAEQRKKELYDELDDEDEDDLILARTDLARKKPKKPKKGEL